MRTVYFTLTLATLLAFAVNGQAAVIATGTMQNGDGTDPFTPTYTPSSTDLINGKSPIASSPVGDFAAVGGVGGIPVLTDGTYGTIGTDFPSAYNLFADAGPAMDPSSFVTYSLGSNPLGYNISEIDTYGGWVNNGRSEQGYHVAYSTVASPATFIDIVPTSGNAQSSGVPFYPAGGSGQVASEIQILDNTSALLATGVADIRFTFDVPVSSGWEGYAELDVLGTPTPAPEPATVVLAAIGALACAYTSLRRRANFIATLQATA